MLSRHWANVRITALAVHLGPAGASGGLHCLLGSESSALCPACPSAQAVLSWADRSDAFVNWKSEGVTSLPCFFPIHYLNVPDT